MSEKDPKLAALRQQGTLNPRSREVTDPLFAEDSFFGARGGDRFRLLAALVLSSAVRLPGGGAGRPGSPQARSQAGAQADRRTAGLPPRDAPERAGRADPATGALAPGAFRDQGSSAQHRTQPAASSKKTPLKEPGAQLRTHPDLTAQYEQLRRDATRCQPGGEGLGLALFLRSGMTAWMQAWSQCTDRVAPNPHPQPATPTAVPMDLQRQIAALLAGIILSLQQEASHERNHA